MELVQLISTGNEKPRKNSKHIYLGNWCLNNSYIIKNKTVVPYHWDDRNKIKEDNDYLNNLYEKLISCLHKTLNETNQKKYSKEYWRTIIGYWLFYYLSVSFDRWENISLAFSKFPKINFYNSVNFDNEPIPATTREFMNLSSSTVWNHVLYSKIINFLKKENYLNINCEVMFLSKTKYYLNYRTSFFHNFKTFLMRSYMKLFKNKIKNNKIVFFKTYLGLFCELILNFKFKQLPLFFFHKNFDRKIDLNKRGKLFINYKPNNSYEKFIIENINNYIPLEFLENYESIGKHLKQLSLPVNPSLIMSTRSLATDNIFIRYLAEKKEIGSKIFYGQHGGAYGQIKFSWAEEHEIKISDKYLSWGWAKDDNNKVIPMFVLKNLKSLKFKKENKIKKLCYFIRSRQKYTGRIDSSTGSNQMSKYYNDCLKFSTLFQRKIKDIDIVPRFHEAEFEWNHFHIWKSHGFKKFSFTDVESLQRVYKNYELLVFSYIGTGFLESLSVDKPFILISSTKEWPLRVSASESFESLKKANIFFENEDDALQHIRNISNKIYDWWNHPEVEKIKIQFRQKYANGVSDNLKIKKLTNLVKNSINDKL